jgi:hypothetical protein
LRPSDPLTDPRLSSRALTESRGSANAA